MTLSAEALFRFDKSSPADILPKGKIERYEMITKFKDGIAQVKSLTIVGYTDLVGTKTYNRRLSEAQTQTVKLYMVERGVRIPISSEGRGLTEPVQACEMVKPLKERIDCLQPKAYLFYRYRRHLMNFLLLLCITIVSRFYFGRSVICMH